MTKELSKQLCELCGVEPKGGYCSHRDKWCNMCIKPCDKENIIILYPDFGKPENFVKLIELKILTGCTLWGFLNLSKVYTSSRSNFLQSLKFLLKTENPICDKNTQDNIKQSIKEAEWKYE